MLVLIGDGNLFLKGPLLIIFDVFLLTGLPQLRPIGGLNSDRIGLGCWHWVRSDGGVNLLDTVAATGPGSRRGFWLWQTLGDGGLFSSGLGPLLFRRHEERQEAGDRPSG